MTTDLNADVDEYSYRHPLSEDGLYHSDVGGYVNASWPAV